MDHERIRINATTISCGVEQLSGITDSSDDDVLFAIGTHLYHPSRGRPVATFIYSGTVKDGMIETRAQAFFTYIAALKFGRVIYSDTALNPKTGNVIYVAVWNIDHEVFKAWWVKRRAKLFNERV